MEKKAGKLSARLRMRSMRARRSLLTARPRWHRQGSATPAGPPTASPSTTTPIPTWTIHRQDLAIVHNGIIENYLELKAVDDCQWAYAFSSSETDTEVLAHLIGDGGRATGPFDLADAVRSALRKKVDGSFAIAVLHADAA